MCVHESRRKDIRLPRKARHPARFTRVTDLLSRAGLLNQSALTRGGGSSDLEAEGSICNPRVAQVTGGGQTSL